MTYLIPKTTFKMEVIEILEDNSETHYFKIKCYYKRKKYFLFGSEVVRESWMQEKCWSDSTDLYLNKLDLAIQAIERTQKNGYIKVVYTWRKENENCKT